MTSSIPETTELELQHGRPQARFAILASGSVDTARREAARLGQKPRVDIVEMESRYGGPLYDFDWLEARQGDEWVTRWLFRLLERRLGWSTLLALRVVWELQDGDVVYSSCEDTGVMLGILLRLARYRGPRVVLRLEQPSYGQTPLRRTIALALLRFGMKRVDLTLCRTKIHAQMLRDGCQLPESKVRYLSENTDTRFYDPQAPVDSGAQLPVGPFIVSAGLEMRDYVTLIEAVRGLPVHLVIGAGSPWSKFGFEYGASKLPENVTVGKYSPTEMRELYRNARFVVLSVKPSPRACGMNVVLEAWSMGRAVLASGTPGLRDNIREHETGLFVEPGNVAELRAKILLLLERPDEAERLGRNGRQLVLRERSLDRYLDQIVEAVLDVAKHPSAAG